MAVRSAESPVAKQGAGADQFSHEKPERVEAWHPHQLGPLSPLPKNRLSTRLVIMVGVRSKFSRRAAHARLHSLGFAFGSSVEHGLEPFQSQCGSSFPLNWSGFVGESYRFQNEQPVEQTARSRERKP